MARIRSVHPGLWTDERFVSVNQAARLFFIGLWTECDDHGVFEWSPLKLKMRLTPADTEDVPSFLSALVEAGCIHRFEVDGRSFGAVRNFMKWQRPKSPQSVHPLPEEMQNYVGLVMEAANKPDRGTALGKMLAEKQGHRCYYCTSEISHYRKKHDSLEIDHKTPVSRGGEDDVSNLVAACKPCNSLKGAMTEQEFRSRFALDALIANCCEKRGSHRAKDATREATFQREDGGGNSSSVSNETGTAKEIPDPAKIMFDAGLALLTSTGSSERQARSWLGKVRRDYSPETVIAAISQAQRNSVSDPIPYIERLLRNRAQQEGELELPQFA